MPTPQEKVRVYEQLLHDLHFHRTVTMNHQKVVELLDAISAWSMAHSDGNGERSQGEIRRKINSAFEALKK